MGNEYHNKQDISRGVFLLTFRTIVDPSHAVYKNIQRKWPWEGSPQLINHSEISACVCSKSAAEYFHSIKMITVLSSNQKAYLGKKKTLKFLWFSNYAFVTLSTYRKEKNTQIIRDKALSGMFHVLTSCRRRELHAIVMKIKGNNVGKASGPPNVGLAGNYQT